MKHITILFLTGIIIMLTLSASAQKLSSDKPITISDISAEKVWQIAEMAMNDNKIPVGKLDLEKGLLLSDWLEWTAIAIQNRGRLLLKYDSPNLVLNMADREYKSDKGWVEAIGSLSKKNYATYMQAVADRITEINKDETLTKQAVKTSELIPAFNPVITVGEVVLTLVKTQSPENHPLLDFTVLNTSAKPVKVTIKDIGFHNKTGDKASSSTYGDPIWSRIEGEKKTALIQPGENLALVIKIMVGASWRKDSIPQLSFTVECDSDSKKVHPVKIYNIPLTEYTYIPEEQ